jgi:hypothetical protein
MCAVAGEVLLSTGKSSGQPSIWIDFTRLEGPRGRTLKHRRMPLTLGVRVLERRPSPSPDLLVYWLMEPSDPATSPRGHRETPCAIHGWGTCPYPVASRRMKLSSPSSMEGGGGVATAK